ncbi:hypothetical protein Q1695_006571 [Nippostrongylus brasiliensis]|nr:hypothetical protein Q1695_006571 [Nippostrongylus brasiliensis]
METEDVDYTTHRKVILCGVVIFTIIGLFGNISLITIHFRKPNLRTKHGLLLSLLSLCQSFCLIYEWAGIIHILSKKDATRSSCLKIIAGYVFLHCMQTGLLATIAVDLLISITLPFLHRVVRHNVYVCVLSLPSVLYGLVSVAFGFATMDDDPVEMCNPPSSLSPYVKFYWYMAALVAGAITVIGYCSAYCILLYQRKHHANQSQEIIRKSMRTMSIILLIFLLTRYLATIGANIMNMASIQQTIVTLYQNYCVSSKFHCTFQNNFTFVKNVQ